MSDTWIRLPVISPHGEVRRDRQYYVTVNLLRDVPRVEKTVDIATVADDDPKSLPLSVASHMLGETDQARGTILLHRYGDSVPCILRLTPPPVPPEQDGFELELSFYHGTRFSGVARRYIRFAEDPAA